jgi:[ribosomal protein S5]-alanine N-acetyltransferase
MQLRTQRLVLREFTEHDTEPVLALLNDPDWLRYIGDKHIRTVEDAQRYLHDGPLAMYARRGYGLYRVDRQADGRVLGMCGLIRRDTLPDVDLGFAFLPFARGQGYAREAGAAILAYGFEKLRLPRIVAITTEDNAASARVLEAIGMRFEGRVQLAGEDEPLRLYAALHA